MSSLQEFPVRPIPIDMEQWPRRDHFHFYNSFLEPFFSVTANVDCTGVVSRCKQSKTSPTLRIWHAVLKAANQIEAFTMRVKNGQPVRYDTIHLSPTVLRDDETFGISFIPYSESLEAFEAEARPRLDAAKRTRGLQLDLESRRQDLVHFSTIPWFRFTALTHARPLSTPDSEPKITLGRFALEGERWLLPVSITVHHGLADGLHVAKYLERLEELMNGS